MPFTWTKEYRKNLTEAGLKSHEARLKELAELIEGFSCFDDGEQDGIVEAYKNEHRDLLCNFGLYFENLNKNNEAILKKSRKYFTSAVELYSDPFAQTRLAHFMLQGKAGYEKNPATLQEAFKLLKLAEVGFKILKTSEPLSEDGLKDYIDYEDPFTCYYLAHCFHNGWGTPIDLQQALAYYNKAKKNEAFEALVTPIIKTLTAKLTSMGKKPVPLQTLSALPEEEEGAEHKLETEALQTADTVETVESVETETNTYYIPSNPFSDQGDKPKQAEPVQANTEGQPKVKSTPKV